MLAGHAVPVVRAGDVAVNILAIDLGTKMGYARLSRDVTTSGTVSFAPRASEGPGARWAKFRAWLASAAIDADLSTVYYESLIHMPTNQPATVMMFGGFEAHLQHWCEVNRIPLVQVNVATIKKHWTGSGRAKKPDMIAEAKRRGLSPADDNEADALALLDYARCAEGAPTALPIELLGQVRGGEDWTDPFRVDPRMEPASR